MGKYAPLTTHLRSLPGEGWTASFAELEEVLGFALPPSARKYEAWWQPGGTHTQARGWTDAGWHVEKLDLARGWVRLAPSTGRERTREGIGRLTRPDLLSSLPATSERPPPAPEQLAALEAEAGDCVAVSVEFVWRSIGRVCLDQDGELLFPSVEDIPGLYRFCFVRSGVMHAYVGETDGLRRRLYHYRRPGPSQQTNIRLNGLLKQALAEGLVITVGAMLGPAQMRIGASHRSSDMTVKTECILLEHAALAPLRQGGARALNAGG